MNNILKIGIIMIIIWGLYQNIALVFSFDKIYPEKIEMTGVAKVVSQKTEKARSNSYTVKIKQSNIAKSEGTKLILYTSPNCDLQYGDIVQISGEFSKAEVARNYKGFSYRDYLKQSKVYGSLYAKDVPLLAHETSLMEGILVVKEKLYQALNQIYENDTNAFLKSILLGDSSQLDEEIKENFRDSSLSHVLAISGMHVSYVMVGMQAILDQLFQKRKLKNWLILAMLGFFVLMTGRSSLVYESLYNERDVFDKPECLSKKSFLCDNFIYISDFVDDKSLQFFGSWHVAFFWWNFRNCTISSIFEKMDRM